MPTDPPASDLGAVLARLAQPRKHWSASLGRLVAEVSPNDLDILRAAYDAQAARLANQAEAAKVVDALVRERDAQAARLAAVEPIVQALARWPLGCPEFVVALRDLKAVVGAVGAGEA